ncbi:hypothetical protein J7384_06615 [Endozoicomonas sp. G2_1]|uniref:hypothetical protein n=1 Tax=Endozoicomonas sp. G2_1 TaxID=2821091 RepID=UPI001ADB5796|nr:hypothetical protein [Endozoicomonas sp. G2_1]MBO9490030.1 hypothetical protein [Endozoicomonas sp. G2_1]
MFMSYLCASLSIFKERKLKYNHFIAPGLSLFLLNGCFDVDDSGNAEIAQAIQNQTQAIASQNQQNTVTFRGLVTNALDGNAVSSALVTVKLGSKTIVENLAATNGQFEVANLLPNSDIEVIITSENNTLLQRAFFLNTGDATSGNVTRDFGTFSVSEPLELDITVLNQGTGLAFERLEFNAFSHVGTSSTFNQYKHTSSYDADMGVYKISIPKNISTDIRANLDFNGDGDIDFRPESNNNLSGLNLIIRDANNLESSTLYVNEVVDPAISNIEYRISLLDNAANTITGAMFSVDDINNSGVRSSFDNNTQQYVVNARFENSIELTMPAFESDGVNYQSASIRVFRDGTGQLRVNTTNASGNCCYNIDDTATISLALQPRVVANNNNLEVVFSSSQVNSTDSSYTALYSRPISLRSNSVSLRNRNGVNFLRGNESDSDLVLPGTTVVTFGTEIPIKAELSLNDTRLKVTPTSAITVPGNYQYDIAELGIKGTTTIVNPSGDSLSFVHRAENQAFDINDVRLDNGNFTTNGNTIVTTNTANEASNSQNFDRSAYLYFPASIDSLKNFTLRKVNVVSDGISRTNINTFNVVSDGNVNVGRVALLRVAANENVQIDRFGPSVILGTAQGDTPFIYRVSSSEFLSDNLVGSENSVSYEYAFETKSGEVKTGTITLPVQ